MITPASDSGFHRLLKKNTEKIRNLSLPGLQDIPVYEIAVFFGRGFSKGSLVTRASAIAFNILLAILPATIFFFSLIPFIKIPNFQSELLNLLANMIPENAFTLIENTLVDMVTNKDRGLLIFMFFMTIILSSNGLHALISAFNVTTHEFDTHSWIGQRLVAIFLFLAFSLIIGLAVSAILFGKMLLLNLFSGLASKQKIFFILFYAGKWIGILFLILISLSLLYYLAPGKGSKWHFFSPGALAATFLFVVSSLGFSYYVNNFGQYNKVYGSLGTLLVILLWIYFNSISILLGFELNASIKTAKHRHGRLRLISPKKETDL